MKEIKDMSADDVLSDEVFENLYSLEDPIARSRMKVRLRQQAKKCGVVSDFDELIKGYNQADREMKKLEKESKPICTLENYTNFAGPYEKMYCGGWVAEDNGIFAQTSGALEEVACYHPILPIERLKNLETGEEQIKLAYKRNNRWMEIIVPKIIVTSASKIVALSGKGIAVTSENAKLLVKYLSLIHI